MEPLKCLTHGELYERNVLFQQTRRSTKTDSNLYNNSRRQMSVEFDDESETEADENDADAKASSNVDITAIITGQTKMPSNIFKTISTIMSVRP